MDPKKNKPKTGSQPMNVDPTTAARMSNLPVGGSRNIRVRKLSDEEKAQSRQGKVKRGLESLTGRSFGGGEPTAGGDVDPKTGNLLPKDPRRPKKNRNVGGPAGPGDIDPETGDLIGEGAPEPSSGNPTGNPYKFRGIADLKKKLADINARGKEQEQLSGGARPFNPKPKTQSMLPLMTRTNESVKKAGHPESFELGLDAETTDNPEYQKILRQKRVERAKQMLNPKLARTMGDDVSQDDVEAADRAARRQKFNPRNVGKDAY